MSLSPVSRERGHGNPFELYAWLFMRVSGLLLIFLVLGHFAIMHVVNSVDDVTYEFVVARWASPFWRLYDFLLLVLALLHGLNGLRVIVDDHVHSRGWRVVAMSGLYTIAFVFLSIGSLILLTFQPTAGSVP